MSENYNALIGNFISPPDKFGEVAFYWWIGDKLTKKRLLYQLDKLKNSHVTGLQINYCHTDKGGYSYGLPYQSDPPLFSEKWWKLFGWFMEEAGKRGMSVSLSDYTLATAGQGYIMDKVLSLKSGLNGSVLRCKEINLSCGQVCDFQPDENFISATYFYEDHFEPVPEEKLKGFTHTKTGVLRIVCKEDIKNSLDPMNPDSGKLLADSFFGEFERRFPGKCGKNLNYFFSDELNFNISGKMWNKDFAGEFEKRKGYDVRPFLAALFTDIGDITPKIRLDYYDVIVSLEEENYFRPVFDWHEKRNMTYGCDHGGRGRNITEFGDYFRTQKYNQGPGNDQPALRSDIIKDKVSASIAHLYKRPRVWLEGFYGSGWQTSSADVADAVFRNFALGSNLLTLHGLYYTTFGGFWEWAPPCNHFRMPYFAHMKTLMLCFKRLSFLLSYGKHVCDVAVLYPVADAEAGLNGNNAANSAFEFAQNIYKSGTDFDFIDFESLGKSVIKDKKLHISGEEYQLIVIPDMKAIRFTALKKLKEFAKAGGKILFLGSLPIASDRKGANDPLLDGYLSEIVNCENVYHSYSPELSDILPDKDFLPPENSRGIFFTHRKIKDADFYFIYGAEKNSHIKFRSSGYPELLDPYTGKIYSVNSFERVSSGTIISMPLEKTEPLIILFRKSQSKNPVFAEKLPVKTVTLPPEWNFSLIETLDNSFGDFSLPATKNFIGAQVRKLNKISENGAESKVTVGYGELFRKFGPYKTVCKKTENSIVSNDCAGIPSTYYSASLRYGYEGDPGHQGYHGLKGCISDDFIVLGKPENKATETVYTDDPEGNVNYFTTFFKIPSETEIYFLCGKIKPEKIWIDGKDYSGKTSSVLKKGCHYLVLRFAGSGRTHFMLSSLPEEKLQEQSHPLSMKWYKNKSILDFDPYGEKSQPERFSFAVP